MRLWLAFFVSGASVLQCLCFSSSWLRNVKTQSQTKRSRGASPVSFSTETEVSPSPSTSLRSERENAEDERGLSISDFLHASSRRPASQPSDISASPSSGTPTRSRLVRFSHSDLDALLSVLPEGLQESLRGLEAHNGEECALDRLVEIVFDVGRRPEARFVCGNFHLDSKPSHLKDIERITSHLRGFGPDNRSGMERVLHRISAIRNRDGHIVGLTCRVGRALGGCASKIRDLVQRGESLLLLGRPGVGKTTAIRDIARVLADEAGKRVVIIDSANEIGGDGDVPHLGIGRARRLQIGASESQHRKMIEAVENHMPEVVVIDEIGTEEEAAAAQTIAQRGVQLIGTAHGNSLECLTKNPTLVDLVGGIESVTLGDEEARRRSSLKTVLERRAPPVFSVCVEMAAPSCWVVHPDVASAVDLLLQGVTPQVEVRSESPTGGVSVASRLWHPSMTPPRAAPFASLFQPSVISAPSVGTEVWEGDLMSSSSRVWTLQRSSVEGGNQGDEIEELLDEGEGEKDGSVETGREEEEEVERKEVVSGPASSLFEVPSPSLLETGDLAENATEIRGEGSPDSQEREIVSVSSGVTSSSAEDGAPEDGVVEIEVESERRELDKGNRTSSAVLAFERLREIVRDDDARRKLEREFLRRHLLTAKKSNPSASVLVETGREEKRRRKEEERERIRQEQRREAEEEEAAKEREAAETRKRRAALRKERRENRAVTKKEKKKQSPKSRRLSKLKEVLQNTEMREEDPGEIFENAVSKDQSAASTAELVAVYGHGDGKEGGKVEEDADSEDDVEEQQREREREYEKRMAALIAWNPEEEVTQIESESDRNTFSGLRIYSLSISDTRMRTVARAIGLDSSHLRVTHDIAAADAVIALKEEVHDGPAAAQLQELAASLGRPLPVFLVHHESPVQIAKTIRRLMARAKGLKGQVPGRNGGRGTRRKKGGSGRAGRSAAAASVS